MKITHALTLFCAMLVLVGCQSNKPKYFMTAEEKRAKLSIAEGELAEADAEVNRLKTARAEGRLVQALIDELRADEELIELLQIRQAQAKEVESLGFKYLDKHPEVMTAKARLQQTDAKIDEKADWLVYQAEKERADAQKSVTNLEAALKQ